MEFIDEHPVVAHRVRFKGRADINEDRAPLVRDDMVVMWLVRTRSLPPEYHPIKKDSEERYRFNIQNVEEAQPLQGAARESAIVYLEHLDDGQSYLAFDNPAYVGGEMVDYSSVFEVERIAKFIAEHDIAQIDDETVTDTVLRLLGQLVDRAEAHLKLDESRFFEVERPAETSAFDAIDERLADDGHVRVSSVYGDRRPSWMKER